MLLYSSHLEDDIDRDRVMTDQDDSPATLMEWQVVSALEEWTTSSNQVLCIVGPNRMVENSPTTMIARKYVVTANRAEIPTISYLCDLPRPHTKLPKGMTAEMSGLVSLIYALIRQLIEVLPSFASYTQDLGASRFAKLDGSAQSYDEAIGILGELLDLSPPMLFCVIDSFEILDDISTMAPITSFINTLRGHKLYKGPLSTGSDRVLKILFTTAGRSRALLTELNENELVFAERAGFASGNRRSLSPTPLKALKNGALQ